MKKQLQLILTVFILVFTLLASCKSSCEKGSGKAATENRKLDAFTKISLVGNYKLVLKQGAAAVTITADDNLLKSIETEVSSDELKISTKGSICNASPMVIAITNPNFQSIKSSGAVDVSSDSLLNIKDFDMEFAGVSKVNLEMNAGKVKTLASGTAEINLKGQASDNTVIINGSGSLNAVDFTVANYRIETKGNVSSRINVLSELSVNISGAGSVQYKGNPSKINNENSGATSIKKIQ